VDPDSLSPVPPARVWQTQRLDGPIYGQPLVYGSRVYVATENNSVYALDAATGALLWRKNAGPPVPASTMPGGCTNIDTIGITSTPVIDPAAKRIYAVGTTWDGRSVKSIRHRLVGFALVGGAPVPGLPRVVDPPGSNPRYQLQRTALAFDRGRVVIGYGAYSGDCGDYHGWLVAAPVTGRGKLLSYKVAPSGRGGGIWGGGNGAVVDQSGDIWVATSENHGLPPRYEHQNSVLRLSSDLRLIDSWAPANWQRVDAQGDDLGTTEPLLLPGGLLFQIGKEGEGFLLSTSNLGGVGAPPMFQAHVCDGAAFGAAVYLANVIYVPCFLGLRALSLDTTAKTFAPLATWQVTTQAIGSPIVAGGLVWSTGWRNGILYGLDPMTGAVKVRTNLGGFVHFASPSAAGGRLFVCNGYRVTAFRIAKPPGS
jgi:outer membrane protein assembly factor BamB